MSNEDTAKTTTDESRLVKNSHVRVEWDVQKTESGIDLSQSTADTKKQGLVVDIWPMPVQDPPGSVAPIAWVAGDDKQWHQVPLQKCKIL